ncbi:hypothetical protein STRDD10_00568 [Streptococcus sp. DD10]|uniref:GNAT family N-acetyltransferase n=1 Tax=Streptococcus sp. DD10 TaxID=1777878 RepID=UPI0007931B97|nr:GNAT family N-acetyltransferase [Streptococcus sp. DD10]KXT74954.1 hypothetical protein STRDD10_00568 [Streptococcus sp. DD10]
MTIRSQLITKSFPDLENVIKLNQEAFPEEERLPISELLADADNEHSHFFAFYNEEEFIGFAYSVTNETVFYIAFFAIMPHLRSQGYGGKIIDKLVEFYYPKTMVLEIERLDEECDNLEQRIARWEFYKRNGFKQSGATLDYNGLSFAILYRGNHFEKEGYEEIFRRFQEEGGFEFEIKYRNFCDL